MTERRFSVDEANAEIADLRERLPRIADARQRLIDTSSRIRSSLAKDGGGVAGTDWFEAQRSLKADLEDLARRGILLRDPESGLVDFPAEVNGRPVLLCWRLGEAAVAHYHDERSGFSGRRPL
jgi:hypothetical protein